MKLQTHPTFSQKNQQQIILVWLLSVISLVGGIYFHLNGEKILSIILSVSFALISLGGLIYLRYQLMRVTCPACKKMTQTKKDMIQLRWLADCPSCQIQWDLQTGIGGD